MRFNVVLTALRKRVEGITSAMQWDRHTQPISEAIADSLETAPLRGSRGAPAPSEQNLCPEQATELERLLAALSELEKRFANAGDHHPYIALPRPIMRVRHPT